jgi:hypothetical protein
MAVVTLYHGYGDPLPGMALVVVTLYQNRSASPEAWSTFPFTQHAALAILSVHGGHLHAGCDIFVC